MTRVFAAALAVLLLTACGSEARERQAAEPFRVLVFTKTTGYRHDSIPAGAAAIRQLGRRHSFKVDTTADADRFTRARLARYDALVFLSTTGTPLPKRSQQRAVEGFIRAGGGYLGVHAASDTRGRWPWYERLVGTRFKRHDPGTPRAVVRVEDRRTAATRGLPAAWERTDEWYEFRSNPRGRVHVLASVELGSGDRPIAWCRRYDGGRSVYTAMGHTKESYAEPQFLRHLLGAIQMAAGRAEFRCAP